MYFVSALIVLANDKMKTRGITNAWAARPAVKAAIGGQLCQLYWRELGSRERIWCSLWLILLASLCISVLPASVAADELVRVEKAYDGDTILLQDGRKVRYLGINTPEYQEPFYLKAKRLNEKLVLGKEVRLEFDEERADGHERLLAYVYAGDQLVNAKLVEAGLAHAFFIGPSRKYNDLLLRLQAEARQRRIGMWSSRGSAKDLKITSVHPVNPAEPDLYAPYVRIANLGEGRIRLAGYALTNEEGQRYVFPDVSLEPGYTAIVAGKEGPNGVDHRGQLVVHWAMQDTVWDRKEDTAFLMDPAGVLVDRFHYKGRRVTKSSRRSHLGTQ